ncbi:Rft protein-domain-containing protein [Cyathus striatus]|nr:Rft protein-domain-containing protein [Cyathus striatus]
MKHVHDHCLCLCHCEPAPTCPQRVHDTYIFFTIRQHTTFRSGHSPMTMAKINSPPQISSSLPSASLSSASSLVALQLFSRLFTFALNQTLFRLVSPQVFGAASIQFELILSTILFLSREGVRNALLRARNKSAFTTNITFLPILLGSPLAFVTAYVYITLAGEEVKAQPGFKSAIVVYCIAALMELLSEPMHNAAMAELKTYVRVRAEGLGIACKSVATFAVLLYDARAGKDGEFALFAFAAGQLVYGSVVFLSYVAYYGWAFLRPHVALKTKDSSDQTLLRLSLTMTSQSLVKHFLTEGDKLILSWFSPLQDQGGYAIAVNYGSLVARIVFQPIEETLRVFFSKLLPNDGQEKNYQNLQQAANAIMSLLSVQAFFAMILVVFGSAYLPIFLPILLPRQYLFTSAPLVLSKWIYYIPVLALNGSLEAFLSSVASPHDLNKQSRWMVLFSIIYISTAIFLYRLGFGDTSLVYANILNLSARIAYCVRFANNYFTQHNASNLLCWEAAIPSYKLCLVFILSAYVISISDRLQDVSHLVQYLGWRAIKTTAVLFHILLGIVMAIFCLLLWWNSNRKILHILKRTKSN